jgi:hypothetical protein
MVCNSSLLHMEDILEGLAASEPHLQLVIPEVMMGGPMYPLFKEYANEAWIDRHPPVAGSLPSANKVCFLVRVLSPSPQLAEYDNPNTWLINKELELLITSKFTYMPPFQSGCDHSVHFLCPAVSIFLQRCDDSPIRTGWPSSSTWIHCPRKASSVRCCESSRIRAWKK